VLNLVELPFCPLWVFSWREPRRNQADFRNYFQNLLALLPKITCFQRRWLLICRYANWLVTIIFHQNAVYIS